MSYAGRLMEEKRNLLSMLMYIAGTIDEETTDPFHDKDGV
jgi:hypothetical protein